MGLSSFPCRVGLIIRQKQYQCGPMWFKQERSSFIGEKKRRRIITKEKIRSLYIKKNCRMLFNISVFCAIKRNRLL